MIIAVVAVVAVIAAAIGYYTLTPGSTSAVPVGADSGPGFTIMADDHTMGNPKAKVTLIEYAAPTCPHCAHFNETVMPQLKQKYIDTGKVFYVFRVFPLHPSDGAVEAMAKCMPADKYFEFIDLMFRNQPIWDWENGVTDIHGGLVKMGRIAGMSADQVDDCIKNQAVQEHVNKVAMDGQTRYSISATPTFVINGVPRTDVATWPDMQTALDAQLAKK